MGVADWVILGTVAVAVAGALVYIVKHKNQCLGCGGNCETCEKR